MSDVRALLKAKRQEVRVKHPYAAYTERGALRCTVCGTGVKHAEAWEGHIGSKAHRMAVMRLKEEEKRRQEEEARAKEEMKRKAEEAEEEQEEEEGREAKRQRTEEREEGAANGFPADFFSDASRAPPLWGEEEEEEGGEQAAVAAPPQKSVIDEEWEDFQRTVLNAPDEAEYEAKEAYERATVFAEPQIVDVTAGMPLAEGQEAVVKDEKLSAEEERKRKQLEDRELIMDRLLEEERVQEEADSRVTLLKARLDTLKKQRELAKAKKTGRT